MTLRFVKMHGAANDFVVLDQRVPTLPADPGPVVRRLCDRRRGVGADGVLLLASDPDADFAMVYYNADGRAAEYCGNGARCLARFALDLGLGRDGEVRFRSAAGPQAARAAGAGIELQFGHVPFPTAEEALEAAGRAFHGRVVRAGVPHFVVPVPAVEPVPVRAWGAALRHHPRFGAAGANVDFAALLGPSRVAMRTYERGVEDETLACGSGAMAVAAWAVAEGHTSPVVVNTAGGDALRVDLRPETNGWAATLTGPAEVVFAGVWDDRAAGANGG